MNWPQSFILFALMQSSAFFSNIILGKRTAGTFRGKLSFKQAFVTLKMKTQEKDFLPDCYQFVMFVMYSRVYLLMKCCNLLFFFHFPSDCLIFFYHSYWFPKFLTASVEKPRRTFWDVLHPECEGGGRVIDCDNINSNWIQKSWLIFQHTGLYSDLLVERCCLFYLV